MGGAIALHFASIYGEFIDNLVLLAPTGFPVLKQNFGKERAKEREQKREREREREKERRKKRNKH